MYDKPKTVVKKQQMTLKRQTEAKIHTLLKYLLEFWRFPCVFPAAESPVQRREEYLVSKTLAKRTADVIVIIMLRHSKNAAKR